MFLEKHFGLWIFQFDKIILLAASKAKPTVFLSCLVFNCAALWPNTHTDGHGATFTLMITEINLQTSVQNNLPAGQSHNIWIKFPTCPHPCQQRFEALRSILFKSRGSNISSMKMFLLYYSTSDWFWSCFNVTPNVFPLCRSGTLSLSSGLGRNEAATYVILRLLLCLMIKIWFFFLSIS